MPPKRKMSNANSSAVEKSAKAEVKVDEKKELEDIFPQFVKEFVDFTEKQYKLSKKALDRLRELFEYTCLGGKNARGGIVLQTVRTLAGGEENFKKLRLQAQVLGWCIEILQACFLVADDIMDGSTTRRDKLCWYKLGHVQLDAVNDTLILESFLYFLIKQHIPDSDMRLRLYELYHEVSLQTQLGQMLDLTGQPQGSKDSKILENFTPTLYKQIVLFKTAFYTFYLPFASGMILCGYHGEEQLKAAHDISIELGEKFQIQDDWLDCYGDPKAIGKIGTDIQTHKCTWLLSQALLIVSPEQRKLIEAHLGKDNDADVQKIKQLYKDLKLPELYEKQEADSYQRVKALIEKADKVIPDSSNLFQPILEKTHKRQK